MNIFQKLYNITLEETEQDALKKRLKVLSTDRDKSVKRAGEWAARYAASEAENRRLQGHIDNARALFAEIHAYASAQKSGAAKKVARMASGGLAK